MPSLNEIAKVCHAANRTYCLTLGDASHRAWAHSPQSIKHGVLTGVAYAIDHPDLTPEQIHRKWVQYKASQGWTFGLTKCLRRKTHPNLCSWESLPEAQQAKDRLFLAVIRSLS